MYNDETSLTLRLHLPLRNVHYKATDSSSNIKCLKLTI